MEYHTTKDRAVASRIFEKGLEAFGKEIEFVLRYLGFLISINDENSWWPTLTSVKPFFLTFVVAYRCTSVV
jgi:hypothetical protein